MAKYVAMPAHEKHHQEDDRAITRVTRIGMITAVLPQAKPLLAEYGIHCFSCAASGTETLEEGCKTHAMDHETIENLIEDLNTLFEGECASSMHITITIAAAEKLRELSEAPAKNTKIFTVLLDSDGRPYMEECTKPHARFRFFHPGVPEILVTSEPLILGRLGTVTVDFRNERFTLDVSSPDSHECKDKTSCTCTKDGYADTTSQSR